MTLIGAHKTDRNNYYFFYEARVGNIVQHHQMIVNNVLGADDIYINAPKMTPLEFLDRDYSDNTSLKFQKS